MIEQILSDVRNAEKQAAEITADAEAKADEIRAEADAKAAEITARAKSDAKNYRESAVISAEREAQEGEKASAKETERECAQLKETYASKAATLAQDIFRRIKDGNC